MKKAVGWTAVLAMLVLCAPTTILAQEASGEKAEAPAKAAAPDHFYKLNFTVEEVNEAGKVTNSRTYEETIEVPTHRPQQIRTGAKIPVAMSENQFQYMDVGINFDVFEPKEVGEKLSFNLTADISSLASPTAGGAGNPSHPVVRQNKWSSDILVAPGRPSVVFSADDLDSKGKMQVELTATRVD
ncbi:MAG: hypothetical protein WA476_06780 [Acidobacteriaceae bacterium]